MIREALEYIVNLREAKLFDIDDRNYVDKDLRPIKLPLLMTFDCNTLTGLMDIIKNYSEDTIVHIVSPTKVVAYSNAIDEWSRRECYALATPIKVYENCNWLSLEEFLINLQTMFIFDDNIASLTQALGNVTKNEIRQWGDDGISQSVVGKKGIMLDMVVQLPTRICLQPRMTFEEITQPKTEFVLRVKEVGESIRAMLFDSSGNSWKYETIYAIKDWIKSKAISMDIDLNIKVIA